MNVSQVDFTEVLSRAGVQVRGGNLTHVQWSTAAEGESVGNIAWVGRDMGIFIVDWADAKTVELEILARKDVIVCSAVLNQGEAQTDFFVGGRSFDAKGADVTMVFVPQHERFRFATSVSTGLKAVTVVVDLASMMKAHGLPAATLPESLLRAIRGREIIMETLAQGYFYAIARDVAARRALFPSLATLYYEGKTIELVSALLSEVSRRDALRAGEGAFDRCILDRLDLVKQIIDRLAFWMSMISRALLP
jgi:hypothetical protein